MAVQRIVLFPCLARYPRPLQTDRHRHRVERDQAVPHHDRIYSHLWQTGKAAVRRCPLPPPGVHSLAAMAVFCKRSVRSKQLTNQQREHINQSIFSSHSGTGKLSNCQSGRFAYFLRDAGFSWLGMVLPPVGGCSVFRCF